MQPECLKPKFQYDEYYAKNPIEPTRINLDGSKTTKTGDKKWVWTLHSMN